MWCAVEQVMEVAALLCGYHVSMCGGLRGEGLCEVVLGTTMMMGGVWVVAFLVV